MLDQMQDINYMSPYYRPSEEEKKKYIQEVTRKIKSIGMNKFAELFCEVHEKETHVISPLELAIKGEIGEEYSKAEKEFHLNFLREHMRNMNPNDVARMIAFHKGGEIENTVYEKLTEKK